MEEDELLEWEDNPSDLPFMDHMIAGSVAGLAEHLCMFPVDTLKTNIQCERCGSVSPLGTWECAAKIVGREGFFRLWRGVTATFAGCIPAHAAYFSIFEFMKVFSGAHKDGHHPFAAGLTGAAASFAHDTFMTPFDTIKQRMQLGYYQNFTHCIRTMLAQEGVGAFYVSLPTTVLMNLPYGVIMVAVNESVRKVLNPSGEYAPHKFLIAGSIAGAAASVLTTPLDVVKTRLQTHNLRPCPRTRPAPSSSSSGGAGSVVARKYIPQLSQFAGIATTIENEVNKSNLGSGKSCGKSSKLPERVPESSRTARAIVRSIVKEQGFRGLLSGALPRMMIHAPSVAISWTAYESVKDLLLRSRA